MIRKYDKWVYLVTETTNVKQKTNTVYAEFIIFTKNQILYEIANNVQYSSYVSCFHNKKLDIFDLSFTNSPSHG